MGVNNLSITQGKKTDDIEFLTLYKSFSRKIYNLLQILLYQTDPFCSTLTYLLSYLLTCLPVYLSVFLSLPVTVGLWL